MASSRNRQIVLDASAQATGVAAGRTVVEAMSRCANSATLPADSVYLSEVNDGLLADLCQVVPNVGATDLGTFYLDLAGMAAAHGGIDGLADAILSVCDGRLSPRLGTGGGH